ncbi:RHS repeat domain-containing protein [Sinomicrobium sp. M5D2P9]
MKNIIFTFTLLLVGVSVFSQEGPITTIQKSVTNSTYYTEGTSGSFSSIFSQKIKLDVRYSYVGDPLEDNEGEDHRITFQLWNKTSNSAVTPLQTMEYNPLSGPHTYYNEVQISANTNYELRYSLSGIGSTITYKIIYIKEGYPIPSRPNNPEISALGCNEVTLRRVGTPPEPTTWYWQGKDANGMSTTKGSGTTFKANEGSGTYYIRARNSSGWSTSSGFVYVNIPSPPARPDPPTITNNDGSTILTRGTPPEGVTWYWQETEGGESISNSDSSIELTSGTVYYLKARLDNVNCWSPARIINYTVNDSNLPPFTVTDQDRNWISTVTYDIDGNMKANSVSYANALGKPVQVQSVDVKTGKIWAAQTLYDGQGRAAFQTAQSAIDAITPNTFKYRGDFIKKSNGSNYTAADFETNPDNPAAVGNQAGTVGWYYSESNTSEPYQDVTAYPFSRQIFSELSPGSVLKSIGGNKIDGAWPQAYAFTMQASGELAQSMAFGESKYTAIKTVKTVGRDAHGVENVVFTDTDGRTLAAARSGGGSVRSMTLNIGQQGYADIHVPAGTTGFTVNKPSGVQTSVYNLITEKKVTTATTSLPNGFYRVAVTDVDNYNPGNPVKVTYKENYYDYALNEYDKAGHLIASYQPFGNTKSVKPKTTFKYDALGQLIYTNSPDEGEAWFKYRKDGQIRYSQNSKQKAAGEFSYTNYDNRARPVESGVVVSTAFNTANPDTNTLPSGTKKEQQFTVYDTGENIAIGGSTRTPSFVAGNVAKTRNAYTTTWYSYDVYGRVSWMVQDIAGIGKKTIDYEYHPVNGQVSRVVYQKDVTAERFIHRYTYDKTDQLVKVETSVDGVNYAPRATYSYYENGGLKRTELGNELQGIDYVYNISGQLKSINHPALSAAKDPGADGNDIFGMTLDYHRNDYMRNVGNVSPATYGQDRLDGNIKGIRWNNRHQPLAGAENAYSYTYDRNNWLSEATYGQYAESSGSDIDADITSTAVTESGSTLPLEATNSIVLKPGFHAKAGSIFTARIVKVNGFEENAKGDYNVALTYDANGNIQTLNRNKNTAGNSNAMDKLTYNYSNGKPNRLDHVKDAVTTATGADDIKGQATGNYVYNAIGQLVENKKEGVKYVYNAAGLVTQVQKNNVPLVKFFYNDRDQRVKKESYTNGSLAKTEYYVRDASGSIMAIYQGISAKEYPIYGGSRLGVYFKTSNTAIYQLTDHLGNVRALIQENGELAGATDYYPGGMSMPTRKLTDAEGYRYGYQGEFAETDVETGKPAFKLRLYDPRINRWVSPDPANQYVSPYLSMGNNWIGRVDPDGGFDSWLGAFFYKIFNGGGEIYKTENGGFHIGRNTNDGGVEIITGYQWEKDNLHKFAIGYETQATLTFAAFIGTDTNGGIQQVYFPKYPDQMSVYGSIDSGPKITTELDASVGVGQNYFVSYYDGDTKDITPEEYAGRYWAIEGAIGASVGLNPEGRVGYSRTYPDEAGGKWHTVYLGKSVSIGPQLGTTFGVSGSIAHQQGVSKHLINYPFPVNRLIRQLKN